MGGAGAFGAAKPTVNAKNNRTAQRWQEKPRRSGGKKPRRGGENLAVGEAGAFGAAKPTDFGAAKPTDFGAAKPTDIGAAKPTVNVKK